MSQKEVDDLISRHILETRDGLVDCPVNELARGQCTVRDHFILKIDICNSTAILSGRRAQTYARIMHPFFATIDAICQRYGADGGQTEYHGDSVLALFPERGNTVEGVLAAAITCHYAFRRLVHDYPDLRPLDVRARTVLHYGPLSVVVTGPYGESHRVALGIPIHEAAKREKYVAPGTIWVSDQFGQQLPAQRRSQLLNRQKKSETYTEKVLVPPKPLSQNPLAQIGLALAAQPPSPPPTSAIGLRNALSPQSPPHSALSLARGLGDALAPKPRGVLQQLMELSTPIYEDRQRVRQVNDGWTVNLEAAYQALNFPLTITTMNRR